jgi:hypothetical protein
MSPDPWAEPTARAEFAFPRPLNRKQTDSGQRTSTHQLHRSQSDNVPLGSHSRPAQANCSISRLCSISWGPRIQGIHPPTQIFTDLSALLTFRRTVHTAHAIRTTKVQKQLSVPRSPFSFSLGSPSQGSPLTIRCMCIFQPSLSMFGSYNLIVQS